MKTVFFILLCFTPIISSYGNDQTPQKDRNFLEKFWGSSKNTFFNILDNGYDDLYLTGYAYHDRSTYTKGKLKDLNEGAYGFGGGKSLINESGNTEMLYVMTHLDSHKDIQTNAGYAWVKKINIFGDLKIGGGYSLGLASRSDFARRFPIPFILPLGTIDYGRVSLNGILIPKLNDGINNGNVLFLFIKYTLN